MGDWMILAAGLLALGWALRRHHRHTFPPDPERWRAPGLGMSVRNGQIRYWSIPR